VILRQTKKFAPPTVTGSSALCITINNKNFIQISDKSIYNSLKSFNESKIRKSVISDEFLDENLFVLVRSWQNSQDVISENPKILTAILDKLSKKQLQCAVQVLVQSDKFSTEFIHSQLDQLCIKNKINYNELLQTFISSYWFATKDVEMDRARTLIKMFLNKADMGDKFTVDALKLFDFSK
jgi:hypothetical protein